MMVCSDGLSHEMGDHQPDKAYDAGGGNTCPGNQRCRYQKRCLGLFCIDAQVVRLFIPEAEHVQVFGKTPQDQHHGGNQEEHDPDGVRIRGSQRAHEPEHGCIDIP